MKTKILIVIIGIVLVLFSTPLVIYFYNFHGSISEDHTYWMEFSTIWASFAGTLISSITIIFLINEIIKNNKNEKNLIFQQQVEIHYRQLEMLTSLYPSEKNCFRQFINKVEEQIWGLYDIYFYYYFAKTNITEWPNEAFKYFIDKVDILFEIKKLFPESPWFSKEEKLKIAEIWHERAGGDDPKDLVESLKYHFGRPLEEEEKCLEIFSMFTDICGVKEYNIKNLYKVAYQKAMDTTNNILLSYFKMHINTIKMLKGADELINSYLLMISGDEKTALIYFLIDYEDNDIINIHLKNNFINNDNTIFGVYVAERIKELLEN
jgi:hypothetical protein